MKKTEEQKKWEKIGNEQGWVSNPDPTSKDRILARNARMRAEHENKTATINTRVAPSDLARFKKIADDKAIPYQTLLQSVVHLYVEGKLVDLVEARKLVANGFKFVEIEQSPTSKAKILDMPPTRITSDRIKTKSR